MAEIENHFSHFLVSLNVPALIWFAECSHRYWAQYLKCAHRSFIFFQPWIWVCAGQHARHMREHDTSIPQLWGKALRPDIYSLDFSLILSSTIFVITDLFLAPLSPVSGKKGSLMNHFPHIFSFWVALHLQMYPFFFNGFNSNELEKQIARHTSMEVCRWSCTTAAVQLCFVFKFCYTGGHNIKTI